MLNLTIIHCKYPKGYIIARQPNPPYYEFWNEGDIWAGSGKVFKDRTEMLLTLDKIMGEINV